MRKLPVILTALVATLALAAQSPARAQSDSPQQIQGLIASGHARTALTELQSVLQAHPNSGVAWYLTAEAQDAAGNATAAASALNYAERISPGLPFANPADVAALHAHISNGNASGGAVAGQQHTGISPVLVGVIGLVILFLALRFFLRPRRFVTQPGYPAGYGQAPGGMPPGAYPYGPAPGMGGGLGGSLLGGLAAGAGFAAGERVIDDVFGRDNGQFGGNFQQDPNFGNGGVPDRDDGLQGNPGWDDNTGGQDDNFDQGNSW